MTTKPPFRALVPSLLLASALVACQGDDPSQVTVTNGKATTRTDFPYVAEFFTGGGYCSATVIGPSAVLTAAHCVEGRQASRMQIRTGEGTFRVRSVEAHPSYAATKNGGIDLALLRIEGTHRARSTICRDAGAAGRDILIMGWGNFVFPARGDTTGTLRFGFNTIDAIDANGVRFTGTAEGRGDGTKVGAGTGDSGGPMFLLASGHGLTPQRDFDGATLKARSTLIGVTSGGTSRGNQTFETYANVCRNRAWLDAAAQRLGVTVDAGEPESTPPPADQDVLLALGASLDESQAIFHVSARQAAAKVRYCRAATASTCDGAPLVTEVLRTVGERKIFRAPAPESLDAAGQTYAIVALDAQDRVISARLVRIERGS